MIQYTYDMLDKFNFSKIKKIAIMLKVKGYYKWKKADKEEAIQSILKHQQKYGVNIGRKTEEELINPEQFAEKLTRNDLEKMNVTKLKEIAKIKKVPGYYKWGKEDRLIAINAIMAHSTPYSSRSRGSNMISMPPKSILKKPHTSRTPPLQAIPVSRPSRTPPLQAIPMETLQAIPVSRPSRTPPLQAIPIIPKALSITSSLDSTPSLSQSIQKHVPYKSLEQPSSLAWESLNSMNEQILQLMASTYNIDCHNCSKQELIDLIKPYVIRDEVSKLFNLIKMTNNVQILEPYFTFKGNFETIDSQSVGVELFIPDVKVDLEQYITSNDRIVRDIHTKNYMAIMPLQIELEKAKEAVEKGYTFHVYFRKTNDNPLIYLGFSSEAFIENGQFLGLGDVYDDIMLLYIPISKENIVNKYAENVRNERFYIM